MDGGELCKKDYSKCVTVKSELCSPSCQDWEDFAPFSPVSLEVYVAIFKMYITTDRHFPAVSPT